MWKLVQTTQSYVDILFLMMELRSLLCRQYTMLAGSTCSKDASEAASGKSPFLQRTFETR
ncbi:hypothetical protein CARUB_v10024472mg [Capsella rubella]|uniref:Uncharacterized protein n=1 Tax=Capsella rubella TaxID=81985 RepID=R0HVZ5_9BRAS|nr:hypothetical protein CARUB_v10024472mg [Capsella rubella]